MKWQPVSGKLMHLQWARFRNTTCQSIDVETKQIQNETTYFKPQTNFAENTVHDIFDYWYNHSWRLKKKKKVTFFVTTVMDL